MKVFISYISADGTLAGKIKEELDAEGFDSFLAHEDIQPTQVWMDSIIQNLRETDIILPLLTKGFSKSVWCNQEIGIGLALEKLIIPVKIDQDPDGFLSRYQALKFVRSNKFPIGKMNSVIAGSSKYGRVFRDFLIQTLADSSSYLDSDSNSKRITEIKDFTVKQLERIMKVAMENSQIYDGFKAKRALINYMYDYRNKVDRALYKKFRSRL